MSAPRRVVVASKNPDKIREVEAVLASLNPPIEVVPDLDWPVTEETTDPLHGTATLKGTRGPAGKAGPLVQRRRAGEPVGVAFPDRSGPNIPPIRAGVHGGPLSERDLRPSVR